MSLSQVNTFVARKQGLVRSEREDGLTARVASIVGLHATDPASVYLSARARVNSFTRETLERELYENKTLVRCLCMRQTLHVVPRNDFPLFIRAYAPRLGPPSRRRLEKLAVASRITSLKLVGGHLRELESEICTRLNGCDSASAHELCELIPGLRARLQFAVGKPYAASASLGSRLLSLMGLEGKIVRSNLRGSWKSNAFDYSAPARWLRDLDLAALEKRDPQKVSDARRWVIERYLAAFGPASLDDIRWWTAFTLGDIRRALVELGNTVSSVMVEGLQADLLIIDDQRRELERTEPSRGQVTLLPALDPYVMGYRDRSRFLDSTLVEMLFDRNGNAGPTVWADGRIVGGWGQQQNGRIAWKVFEPLSEKVQTSLEQCASEVSTFLGEDEVRPRFPSPLSRELAAS